MCQKKALSLIFIDGEVDLSKFIKIFYFFIYFFIKTQIVFLKEREKEI